MNRRSLFFGLLGGFLIVGTGTATELPRIEPTDQDLKAGVDRARSCVLKLECLARNGLGTRAVLSAVAIDDDGHLLTVGLRSPGDATLNARDCNGQSYEAHWIDADE